MTFTYRHEHTGYLRFFQFSFWGWWLCVCMLAACAGVKNPPLNRPYAYNNDVVLRAPNLTNEERKLLEEKLLEYLDDSLTVRKVSVLGGTRRIDPPAFDSSSIVRSMRYIDGYLNSIGYYHAVFDSFRVQTNDLRPRQPEIRVNTTFFITLGKGLTVSALEYDFEHPLLQHLADSLKPGSAILPGQLYTKEKVAVDLDRLAAVFRQRGFMRLSRSALIAEADTNDLVLVGADPDPAVQLIEAYRHWQMPSIRIRLRERTGLDTAVLLQYHIDSVFIYPEVRFTDDLAALQKDSLLPYYSTGNNTVIRESKKLFTQRTILRNNYLQPGSLYSDAAFFKTINSYTQMGPWQQVDSRFVIQPDSAGLVNVHLYLFPAKKQTFQVDLEGSQNNNISVSNVLAGRFLALALNASHRNRNVFRKGTQSTTTATFGLELNNTRTAFSPNFFQTFIINIGQSYTLPRLIKPFHLLDSKKPIDAGRTNINFNALYTERFRFFQQTSISTNLQWEWRRGRNTATITIPNFETVFLQQFQDSLDKVIEQNPSLKFAFTPGNILSVRTAVERAVRYKKSNHTGFYRLLGEFAPNPGLRLFGNDFFTFIRFEGQYVEGIRFAQKRASLHYRLYGGVGWDISGVSGATLPFFRQFVAGGNNSMRAWGLRQLGLGNSLLSDTARFTDRFGDIQLEANIEYRFRLFRFFGYNMEGAVFADIGNIWNHKNNTDGSGRLSLRNFYRDLAMGVGTGIRWDFSYLVIRLDAAYKVKDPVREGAGWMRELSWRGTNRLGTVPRSNVGFQFGIGYPF